MKRCTKCGVEFPEETFEMQPSRGRRRSECRECRKIAQREWYAKRRLNPPKPKSETKRCNHCHNVKPISEFSPGSPGYFHGRCKACEVAIHREKRREQYRNDPTGRFYRSFINESGIMVKRCIRCYIEKQLSEFYTSGKYYRPRCKECNNAEKKMYYDNNPEKYRAYARKYYRKYPEKHNAKNQRWNAANRERLLHRYRAYNETHREERRTYDRIRHSKETPEFRHMEYEKRRDYIQEYSRINRDRKNATNRLYRQTFPEKHAEKENRRRARKLNAPMVEKIDRQAIIERDKWTCYLCGCICTSENITLDHVVPLARGGSHTADNLRVACRSCNCKKHAKHLHDFLA